MRKIKRGLALALAMVTVGGSVFGMTACEDFDLTKFLGDGLTLTVTPNNGGQDGGQTDSSSSTEEDNGGQTDSSSSTEEDNGRQGFPERVSEGFEYEISGEVRSYNPDDGSVTVEILSYGIRIGTCTDTDVVLKTYYEGLPVNGCTFIGQKYAEIAKDIARKQGYTDEEYQEIIATYAAEMVAGDKIKRIWCPSSMQGIMLAGLGNLMEVVIEKREEDGQWLLVIGCDQLKAIYYTGSEADWAQYVKIPQPIVEAMPDFVEMTYMNIQGKVYYYSESKPTDGGTYWHYVKGEPTVWA